MFAGLFLASISAATLRAALFQRKSRSGWLEELDGIREDALEEPDGGVAHVAASGTDLWTDLRDGGTYEDPHEISSLYATDETPDSPTPPKAGAKAKPARKPPASGAPDPEPTAPEASEPPPAAELPPPLAPPVVETAELPPPPAPPVVETAELPPPPAPPVVETAELPPPPAPPIAETAELPPPPPAPPIAETAELPPPPAPPISDAAELSPLPSATVDETVDEAWSAPPDVPGSAGYDPEQIWVQPAPHPIRPSEMWHPAELAPPSLGAETVEPLAPEPPVEERVPRSDLFDTPPIGEAVEFHLEAELAAAADLTVIGPAAELPPLVPGAQTSALIAGPVGRRVRRDRPADRRRTSLPTPEEAAGATAPAPIDRGEQSPLPTAPLPPAAMPTRSNRLPGLETLPATPSSVVSPRSSQPFERPPSAALAPAPIPAAPVAAASADPVPEDPAPAGAAAPAPEAPAASVDEAVAADPVPADGPPARIPPTTAVALEIAEDGLAAVPGTIVRIGGARDASAKSLGGSALVTLREGWCWASPGEGAAGPLRIDLPKGRLTVESGSTALAVVEADGSSFVIVAAGRAELRRGADGVPLERGSLVMVDPGGAAHIDQAGDDEIQSDPIVAENLALDAEL